MMLTLDFLRTCYLAMSSEIGMPMMILKIHVILDFYFEAVEHQQWAFVTQFLQYHLVKM